MENFLSRLNRNPYQPIDGASVTKFDELGNGLDDWGNVIAPKFEAPQQTWGETALGVATAPARLATALVGSLSPYGADGWQVPPVAQEGWNALTAVGDAYTNGMSDDEMRNRALGMAGFMMGGGGIAAGRGGMVAANASKEGAVPALLAGQEAAPLRGYHGSMYPDYLDTAKKRGEFWAASDPSYDGIPVNSANPDRLYNFFEGSTGQTAYPSMTPVEMQFKNPLVAGGDSPSPWTRVPFEGGQASTEDIVKLARERGNDGVIFKNLQESGPVSDEYVALGQGTVRSPLTGETLFSNASKEGAVPALASALSERQPFTLDKIDGEYAAMSPSGDMIGNFRFEETPQAAFVIDAMVKPEYRRQGVASQVYGAIQDDLGKPLTPDVELTPDGYAFWKQHYPDAVHAHRRKH